jgi:hypothetical protein
MPLVIDKKMSTKYQWIDGVRERLEDTEKICYMFNIPCIMDQFIKKKPTDVTS